jgi:hypothetical protein
MSNELIPFKENASLPAHLRGLVNASNNDDLAGGVSSGYPVLSFRGKTWSLREGGTSNIIMKPDDEDEIATSLEVVILKANPQLSKVYYDAGYTEGSDAKPTCYSHNGTTPASDATKPQAATCALCPHNAWGSRISENGSKGKACSDSRRVAVAAAGDLARPMLLRIPAATLKDLAGYAQMLTQRDASYQAVVTKIGFDPTVAHPKLTFKAVRWLSAEEYKEVAAVMASEVVKQIIGAEPVAAAPAKAVDAIAHLPAKPTHVEPEPAPAKPKGASFGKKAAAPPAEEPAEEAPAPKAKTTKLATKAAPAKDAAPKSKAAEKLVEVGEDLDAALAELDDL